MRATQTFIFAMLQHGVLTARSTRLIPLEVEGKTPCCVDRLTSVACSRIATQRKRYFEAQCSTNADFAFIQCCATCFDRRKRDGPSNYDLAAKKLLLNPYSTTCNDRRGAVWCHKILSTSRSEMWGSRSESVHSCKSFPFAFRECRQSCGFCVVGQNRSRLKYNYTIATDPQRCPSKLYFALEIATPRPGPYIKMPTSPGTTSTAKSVEHSTPTADPDDFLELFTAESAEEEPYTEQLSNTSSQLQRRSIL